MNTFDSTKKSLLDLLRDITTGKIQLPDFQRGWVWDDAHIRDLLVSVARAFPIGTVMMLETGGDARFQVRPVEGVALNDSTRTAEYLILDGQQRLTTLTQVLALQQPVETTNRGRQVKHYYYVDMQAVIEDPHDLHNAFIATNADRRLLTNFNRDVQLDLSTRALECEQLFFPCNQLLDPFNWMQDLVELHPDKVSIFTDFSRTIIDAVRNYDVPVIELKKETTKEAVCLVFEKVNTGGVPLSVFELVTAMYAADNHNLRDDWYGSELRALEGRHQRLKEDPLLRKITPTDFLQAITLLYTHERKSIDIAEGKEGKKVRPVSAKRGNILELPLVAYRRWSDEIEEGFKEAALFLRNQNLYLERDIPYRTQLVPLAAVLTKLKDKWRTPRIHDKLAQWFWCGALGELYGSATETRIANDVADFLQWLDDDTTVIRTIRDASFQAERLDTLKSRNSAAYKAINVLLMRAGARDFYWNMTVDRLNIEQNQTLDIHHIFPKKWCLDHGIPASKYDTIINKTAISSHTNRKIGGNAPSDYLRAIEADPQAQFSEEKMDGILQTHGIEPHTLRANDFSAFLNTRRTHLLQLISSAMGKNVEYETSA